MKNIKLQYYLRGLGVGMVVTAVIMGAALPAQEKELTDAQIKERALKLGMVEQNSVVLSDLQKEPAVSNDVKEENEETLPETESATQAEDLLVDETVIEEQGEQVVETLPEEVVSEEPVSEEQTSEESLVTENDVTEDSTSSLRVNGEINTEGNTVTIVIRSGADSYSVSKALEDTGLVEDAKAYDRFLCDGGYSKRIRTGTYMIAADTSEEEIAKIITGNR